MSEFWAAYKDPRWQKKRLEIMKRDGFACKKCKSKDHTLHVHHLVYFKDYKPWDYGNNMLVTLCEECHSAITHLTKFATSWFFMAWLHGNEAECLGFVSARGGMGVYKTHPWVDQARFFLGVLTATTTEVSQEMMDEVLKLSELKEESLGFSHSISAAKLNKFVESKK